LIEIILPDGVDVLIKFPAARFIQIGAAPAVPLIFLAVFSNFSKFYQVRCDGERGFGFYG
jgi:hypothetical protein